MFVEDLHEYVQRRRAKYFQSLVIDIIPGTGTTFGAISLGTELFLVRSSDPKISVYNALDATFNRHVIVPDLKHPWGLAACPHHNGVYISDSLQKCIHRVDLLTDSIEKWELDGTPGGLSVTKNHHLIVTLWDTRRILKYTASGSLIEEISLDVSIDNPKHAVELTKGLFLVCHAEGKLHRVCIVDKDGDIVHSYGGPPSSSPG